MDELKLEYFMSMARHLNFTKAAEDCHVVQATMSKQIAALEEELGVQLFRRDHHAVTLTDAGKRLDQNVENYINQYRNINASLHKLMLELENSLVVGIGFYEAAILEECFRRYHNLFPTVDINCMYYSYSLLVSRVRTGAVDVGICNRLCADALPGHQTLVLRREPYCVVAAGDSDFWYMSKADQMQLKDQVVITTLNNEYEPVRTFCIRNNLKPKAFSFSNNMPAQLALIKSNLGIALLPEYMRTILPAGIRMENILKPQLVVDTCAVYDENNPNAALHEFVGVCRSVFRCS